MMTTINDSPTPTFPKPYTYASRLLSPTSSQTHVLTVVRHPQNPSIMPCKHLTSDLATYAHRRGMLEVVEQTLQRRTQHIDRERAQRKGFDNAIHVDGSVEAEETTQRC